MGTNKILLIEDDQGMVDLLMTQSTLLGHEIDSALDGQTGLEKGLSQEYALAVIDINLPKLGGLEVCKRLRSEKETLPIIILTSRSEEIDKVLGLEFGADDYVTKPFSVREFVARVNAVLRRSARSTAIVETDKLSEGEQTSLHFGKLEINLLKRTLSYPGKVIELSAMEFDLLVFLAKNHGKVFSRDELMEQVWGYHASKFKPTITMYLSRLRSKIEPNPSDPRFLFTVRGVGYRFASPEECESDLPPVAIKEQ